MPKRITLKDHQREISLYYRRAIVAMGLILLMAAGLVARLYYLQVIEHSLFTTLSEKNQVTLLPIPPNRGLIYDRNGILIAENTPVFSLEMIPDKVANIQETLKQLGQIINITPDDIAAFNKQLKQHRRFDSVPIKVKLDEQDIAKFYVNQYRFPGVMVRAQLIRYYPLGPNFVDVLGYVGRINEQEAQKIDPVNYAATNFIGKLGIEKHYEDILHGRVGYQEVETDAGGRIVRVLKRIPPIPGENLYLSIDANLQISAQKALGDNYGAVVAIDPNNGEILAMVSNPGYDPNLFVQGISQQDYQALQNAPGKPLYNRTVRGQYPIASTIKPYLALEALNSRTIDLNFKINDPGYYSLPGSAHVYRDWKKGGHGVVNVMKAVPVSCDTFFYTVGVKMGITHIHGILTDFGFGKPTGIDLDEELGGLIPDPAWKRRVKNQPWYMGDTVISSIGQGFMLTTPLQLANGVSQVAMRGEGYQVHLLMQTQDAKGNIKKVAPIPLTPIRIDSNVWDEVIEAMHNVTQPGGTAASIGNAPYLFAGKTGTGQVFSTFGKGTPKANILPKNLRDNTMFIAFAPLDKPQIAIGIVAENSHDAKYIGRKVLDAYFSRHPYDGTHTVPAPTFDTTTP